MGGVGGGGMGRQTGHGEGFESVQEGLHHQRRSTDNLSKLGTRLRSVSKYRKVGALLLISKSHELGLQSAS